MKYLYILLLITTLSCRYEKEDAGLQAEFSDVQIDSTLTFAEHIPREIF